MNLSVTQGWNQSFSMTNLNVSIRDNVKMNISTADRTKMGPGSNSCVFCAVLAAIVGLITIIVNIFNIVILMDKQVLKKSTRVLLLSVSVADLLVGVVVMFYIYPGYTGRWMLNSHLCDGLGFILYISLFVSIWSLCCLSVDRYMVLRKPLNYHIVVSTRSVYIAVATNWILSGMFASLPLFGIGRYHFNTAEGICGISAKHSPLYLYIIYLFVLPAFIITYVLSFLVLRIINLEVVQRHQVSNNNQTSHQLRHVQTRAAVMIALIVLAFSIAWLPGLIGNLIQALGSPLPLTVEYAIWWLAVCNSFFNFFIYCLTNAQYRQRLVWLLKCRCRHWKRQVSFEVYKSIQLRLLQNQRRRSSRSSQGINVRNPSNNENIKTSRKSSQNHSANSETINNSSKLNTKKSNNNSY